VASGVKSFLLIGEWGWDAWWNGVGEMEVNGRLASGIAE